MFITITTIVLLFSTISFAVANDFLVLETSELDHATVNGWQRTSQIVAPSTLLHLSFAVKLQNSDILSDALKDVSDPKSFKFVFSISLFLFLLLIANFLCDNYYSYGKHWSKEKVEEKFGPSKQSLKIVEQFIKVILFFVVVLF
jgi:hypothetical protein